MNKQQIQEIINELDDHHAKAVAAIEYLEKIKLNSKVLKIKLIKLREDAPLAPVVAQTCTACGTVFRELEGLPSNRLCENCMPF